MNGKLVVENAAESSEWPKPVQKAFDEFCRIADEHHFGVMCAVGMNMKINRPGSSSVHLTCMFSPRSSSNPHRAEMCADIATLFKMMSDRSKQ